jgi:hypothetical protein
MTTQLYVHYKKKKKKKGWRTKSLHATWESLDHSLTWGGESGNS